ncbi:MAG TPA: ChrR family anti-sigma-E factor [Caulobacteraceae bacterium]
MIPAHHPSVERLLEHAAGALDLGRRMVIESHLHACAACRRETRLAEAIGGALLQATPPEELHIHALARALARIETPSPPPRRANPIDAPTDWIEVPRDVLEAVARRRRWAAPGVWVAPVRRERSGARSYLLRVAGGMTMPRHTHKGIEMTCVLKGSFVDRGVVYGQGDFAETDEAVEHRPAIAGDGECVCLVSADNSLVAKDWVGRLFQPLVGI